MCFWILTYLSGIGGTLELVPFLKQWSRQFGHQKTISLFRHSASHLRLIRECLESGQVPEMKDWLQVESFPRPWATIISNSLRELRAQGAPIISSLERLENALIEQSQLLQDSRVKSSQAMGQALAGALLVPLFSGAVYLLIPELQSEAGNFGLLVVFCSILSAGSLIWILHLSENARFGNLPPERRSWLISADSTFERLLALVSSGTPPDLAWRKALEELLLQDRNLVRAWGAQVWDPEPMSESLSDPLSRMISNLGLELRRSIQVSLIEGRACLDRLDSIHRAYRADLKASIGQELELLPQRCLKPLFIFVLPALMILLSGVFLIGFDGTFND
jgi:hypothetical protein